MFSASALWLSSAARKSLQDAMKPLRKQEYYAREFSLTDYLIGGRK